MKGEASNGRAEIRTVKVGNCKSLSGKSTIGYEIGVGPTESIHLRVVRNSGPGAFARKWVALDVIQQALRNAKAGEVTSANIASLFDGGQKLATRRCRLTTERRRSSGLRPAAAAAVAERAVCGRLGSQ